MIALILNTILSSTLAFSAVREIESQRVETIKVQTSNLNLTIREVPNATKLKIRSSGSFDSYNDVTIDGKTLVVKGKVDPTDDSLDKNMLEIEMPAMPIQIDVLAGAISLTRVSKLTTVRLHKGRLLAKNTSGRLDVFSGQAEVTIDTHKGTIDLNSYGAKVNLKDIEGDGTFECFSGDVNVQKSNGHFKFDLYSGVFKADSIQGSLNVKSVKSVVQVTKLSGRLVSNSREGAINISPDVDSDVQVTTKSAKTVIQAPAAGTYLSLQTQEGDLYLPQGLKMARDGQFKVYRGRYRGDDTKLRVSVRSEDGSIQVR